VQFEAKSLFPLQAVQVVAFEQVVHLKGQFWQLEALPSSYFPVGQAQELAKTLSPLHARQLELF
jgi:hypothetical protein